MLPIAAVVGLVAVAVVGSTAVASAAPLLDTTTITAGQRAHIALRMPTGGRGAVNQKLIVHLPTGFMARACAGGGGWRCSIARVKLPTRAILTYEWAAHDAPPSTDLVGFTVQAPDASGTFRVEIDQFFVDGHVFYWGGSPDTSAPSLTVTAAAVATTAQLADTGPGVAKTSHAVSVPKKKDTPFMALYIVIALWLAVVIPVLVAGMKGAPEEPHTHEHH